MLAEMNNCSVLVKSSSAFSINSFSVKSFVSFLARICLSIAYSGCLEVCKLFILFSFGRTEFSPQYQILRSFPKEDSETLLLTVSSSPPHIKVSLNASFSNLNFALTLNQV